MKSLKNLTGDSLEQLIDYQVVDQNGDEIGSLHSLWSEPDTGAVEFLGVKTGWLFGHNHVVPAEKAELDETENVVRLPYTSTFIKEAPSISADAEISEAEEANIYQYYGLDRTGPSIETSTLAPADPVGTDLASAPATTAAAATGSDEAARWRRIKSSLVNDAVSGAVVDKSNPVRNALSDLVVGDTSGTSSPTAATAGSYGTTNLYGSTGAVTPVAEDSLGSTVEDEDAHWQANHHRADYFESGYEYADYAPAYRAGYEGFGRYGTAGRSFEEAEPDLQRDYSEARGGSRLEWEKAKAATRDAWERLKAKASQAAH